MPAYTCPHCQKPFNVPASASAAQGACPHCRHAVALPKTSATRWFFARAKKKYGPYTWQQLLTLAQRGDLHTDDMLLQEGAKQWVQAGTLGALFPEAAPAPAPKKTVPRSFPWLIATAAGAALFMLLGMCLIGGYFLFARGKSADPGVADKDKIVEQNKKSSPPKKDVDPLKKNGKVEEKKDPPEEIKPSPQAHPEWAEQFVERLNRHRKSAGLGSVTLDTGLSAGCLAHAKYLARNFDPQSAQGTILGAEDPDKPGFTDEGQRTGKIATISYGEPLLASLERWMGSVASRWMLLTPEMRSIGIGFDQGSQGRWICVIDPVRGRGEPIVVFPAFDQTEVPRSFTSGPELPDDKTAAGFAITVTFPAGKQVRDARIELHDAKHRPIDGWTWTPEKPFHPARQRNTIALVPKGMLQGGVEYKVKAAAQVDGKPWTLQWSFTTEDGVDGKGTWATKVLARVNAYRTHAGLKAVVFDDTLSSGCQAHAKYLVANEGHPALQGLKAHDEDETLSGFSEAGRAAGKASDISMGDFEPTDSVDAWMATLYHRVPILDPSLERIGFGCARGRRQGWVDVLNVLSGRAKMAPGQFVLYPAPDQTGVPVHFPNSGEEPNPIPNDKTGRAGYPITASFSSREPLKDGTGKLTTAQGVEVPCWFSSPEKVANPMYPKNQGRTVCLIAKAPLAANTTYHVDLQGQLTGKPWEKKWKFTTGESGPGVPSATRQAVERLNQYRAQAGLSAVTLDEPLSQGCQLHATFLVKNADVLNKNKAPVNDEDVNLPGFTREGLRSAQRSLIFTSAPIPVMQIDDLIGSFSSRVFLLDPGLQRIGYGCAHDVGRGWRCVLDINGGRGDSRIVRYPVPEQIDVPVAGFDRLADAPGNPGFPITVAFPRQAKLRNVQAVLTDADDKEVAFHISTPDKPLTTNLPPGVIAVHPQAPLQAGRSYTITISVIRDGAEWRERWQFTTSKKG